MPKEPLFPHVPKRKQVRFSHAAKRNDLLPQINRDLLVPICISKSQLYPEERSHFERVALELKRILGHWKEDRLAFTPPQFLTWYPRPEIIKLTPERTKQG